jgi:UDP-glucuronate 4-epimerase
VSRFLVTGCAGFIGSHLSEALLERGHQVVGVDAFTDYYDRRTKERNLEKSRDDLGFSFVEADLAENSITNLLSDVDGVFHLAAQPGVRGSWGDTFGVYLRDNILATQRLFEASVRSGKRVVFASTSSVYGNAETYPTREDLTPRPVSPYGVTKLACESLARTYAECFGLEAVALRYFSVYGPRQRPDMAFARIISALLDATPFHLYGTGEQSRDFTYVGDAVQATIAAMEHEGRGATYNVGGGSETTLRSAVTLCERLAGKDLDLRHEATAAGDVRRTAADIGRIRSELGWEPTTTLAEGLVRQFDAALHEVHLT